MDKRTIESQLISMRHQVMSLAAAIEAALSVIEEEKCDHKNRINLTAMGGPEEWQCQDCGYHYKEGEE